MSAIHVKTLLEAMPMGASAFTLSERTGYPVSRIFEYIQEARRAGHTVNAVWGGDEMTVYRHEKARCACGNTKPD